MHSWVGFLVSWFLGFSVTFSYASAHIQKSTFNNCGHVRWWPGQKRGRSGLSSTILTNHPDDVCAAVSHFCTGPWPLLIAYLEHQSWIASRLTNFPKWIPIPTMPFMIPACHLKPLCGRGYRRLCERIQECGWDWKQMLNEVSSFWRGHGKCGPTAVCHPQLLMKFDLFDEISYFLKICNFFGEN